MRETKLCRIWKRTLTLGLACLTALSVRVPAAAAGAPWYQADLEYAVAHDIISEDGTGNWKPREPLSRGQLAVMVYQALDGASGQEQGVFQDVPPSSDCYNAVNWIAEQRIARGTGKTTFSPESTVTREQLAVILANAAKNMALPLNPIRGASSFTDAASVSSWAKESLEYCWTRGILNGFQDGSFRPQEPATHCEGLAALVSEIRLRDGNTQAPSPAGSASQEQDAQTGPRLVAHRGLSSKAPENTLKAFELAGQNGFWGAECDVWATADGQYVILHDGTLQRMCGVDGDVSSMTWAQLQNLPIRAGNNLDQYSGDPSATRIPRLEDYLAVCRKYGMVPLIELKPSLSPQQIQEIVDKALTGVSGEVWFLSFNYDNIITLKELTRGNSRCRALWLLLDASQETVQICAATGLEMDLFYRNVRDNLVELCRQAQVPIHLWTLDDPELLPELLRFDPVSITSDIKLF